ncbi:hypothetical protein TN72_004907 [Salmonella enterica subsp. enterica serovar Kedougou]|nr:hypothetical protein [Salmonella enterica subsp. enterica serovar Kedougou]
MKSTLLSTLMLVAVGVQPVFAAQCQYGACGTENDPGIVFLMSSVQMDQGEQLKELSGVATTGDTISKRHCCKVSDEAAFCLIQRPYISKTLLTRRISPRGSP